MRVRDRDVEEVMQREVVSLAVGDRLDLADDIMRLGRIRHMPVLDGDRVVGIVSSRDLLAASLSRTLDFDSRQRRTFMRSVDVGEVMTRDVVTVATGTTLGEAAASMLRHRIGCLPVVDAEDRFIGLVTETDLIRVTLLSEDESESREIPVQEGKAMANLRKAVDEELETLRRVRDELRVQVHLGKAEAREQWEKLEQRFEEAEARVKRLAREADEPAQELGRAVRLLMQELRDGYRRVRDAL
jgi:CBS domain-containing protein